jgi:outer membrane protein assembly factor BamB
MTGDRTTCNYCGTVVERARPAAPEVKPRQQQQPEVIVIKTDFSAAPKVRRSGCASCLIPLVILLIIGGVAAYIFAPQLAGQLSVDNLSQLPGQIAAVASVSSVSEIFLTGGENPTPQFMTYTGSGFNNQHTLTYVDVLSSTIRWHSPDLSEWYASHLIESPERIFITDKAAVLALNRADGQVLWRTSLADTLVPSCLNCLNLFDTHLAALLQGGTVQAFDTQTGQLAWSKRLNSEYANRFVKAGNQLILFDRSQDNRDELMLRVNPANGETLAETIIPECSGEQFDDYHPSFYQPERDELYFIFGDIIGPACVQVWKLSNQQIVRQITLDNIALPSNFREFDQEHNKAIMAGDKLYFSATQSTNGQTEQNVLIELNPADGAWRTLGSSPDYQLIPLAVADNLLIASAVRTRGTERSELWGLDLASGETRWQYVLQAPRWYKKTGQEPMWDSQLTPHGLVVLQIFDEPAQLLVEKLNPLTGVSSGQNTIPLSDDYLTGIAWTPDSAWLALDKIYAVDLKTGTLAYNWP